MIIDQISVPAIQYPGAAKNTRNTVFIFAIDEDTATGRRDVVMINSRFDPRRAAWGENQSIRINNPWWWVFGMLNMTSDTSRGISSADVNKLMVFFGKHRIPHDAPGANGPFDNFGNKTQGTST